MVRIHAIVLLMTMRDLGTFNDASLSLWSHVQWSVASCFAIRWKLNFVASYYGQFHHLCFRCCHRPHATLAGL